MFTLNILYCALQSLDLSGTFWAKVAGSGLCALSTLHASQMTALTEIL